MRIKYLKSSQRVRELSPVCGEEPTVFGGK